ncbi:TatD family hydrolase [Methanotorris igneus]|uniref:TatD-related deoxyribonuclease n=1 Tax=Methanotorris igneus (strain DSM 5666 / JCM 11834 / Kol 5) TaxID=880724 RepID=F6BAV4_METIK|nr:TatD family hydrolase [Methanotorris igneus]AEF97041.1 TatD-related deoxyribonuclease [Methanotorris igneus Kol 5]
MIDAHIHADTRPYEDFEMMALCMDGAITLAHDPFEMKSSDAWVSHVERLINNDVKRAQENGLKLFVCVGIHPRAIPKDYENAIEKIKDFVKNDVVVGIGEIGLEKATKEEKDVFIKQLLLAKELDLPAVVHTPRRNKEEITKIIIEEINSLDLKNEKIVIDHCNKNTVKDVLDIGCYAGLTVQPSKLTPMEAVEIVKEFGGEKILLDSDSSSAPSDILSVPKTVLKMKLNDVDKEIINLVSHENAKKLFNLTI